MILHIVRRAAPSLLAKGPGHALLLLGQGASSPIPSDVPCYFEEGEPAKMGAEGLSDHEIIELIFRADKVVVW